MQLGEKERQFQSDNMIQKIINYIAENCVHPQTNRQFSSSAITQAIKEVHFRVNSEQNEKVQAKKCIKRLQRKYLIKRADMLIELGSPIEKKNEYSPLNRMMKLLEMNEILPKNEILQDNLIYVDCVIQPIKYQIIDNIIKLESCKEEHIHY